MKDAERLMNELNDDLAIDRLALEVDWETHARLFMKWAEREVRAERFRDETKADVERHDANLDLLIRAEASKSNVKITEAYIQAKIQGDIRHGELIVEYFDARERAGILKHAVEAFDHRKTVLENLTKLWISGYWADPKIGQGAKQYVEGRDAARTQEAFRDAMKGEKLSRRKL